MKIKQFTFNPLQVNTYLIWDDKSLEAAVIDFGANSLEEENEFSSFVCHNKLILKKVLLSHTHFDHIYGLLYLYKTYKICPSFHSADDCIYKAMPDMASQFGFSFPTPLPPVESFLKDGDIINLGEIEIQAIHTPGHSPGGLCFYIPSENTLFSGDTLFHESIGRADLPGGNYDVEIESIKNKLLNLPTSTKVYTGHGPSTTIAWEKTHNFYL
jgi:glyoxylase-like metal-dependent hydrolase (beta-lactamase superfamily II)